ncbi:MAG: hypothetical protein ABSA42_04545 [Terracidiphilus sp.]
MDNRQDIEMVLAHAFEGQMQGMIRVEVWNWEGSRPREQQSGVIDLVVRRFILDSVPESMATIALQKWLRCGRGVHRYSFFRRYSNTTYPIIAEIMAIKKFVPVKISFKANARLFPGPFITVNSPIKRLE